MAQAVEFKFSALVLAIPFGIAAVLVAVAVWLFLSRMRVLAALALLAAALPGLLIGPMMLMDRVVVTAEKVEQTTGFFWSPTVKGFRFADVDFVHITQKPVGPKQRISTIWEVHEKAGGMREVDPGDLWETNSDEIVRLLTGHGVTFRP